MRADSTAGKPGGIAAMTCENCGKKINSEAYRSQERRGAVHVCSNECRKKLRRKQPTPCKACGQMIPPESYFVTKCDQCRKPQRGAIMAKNHVPRETIELLRWYYTTDDYRAFVTACRESQRIPPMRRSAA